MQLCFSLNILWQCLSLGLEWKPTFSSPVATAEFSKFAGIWSVTLLQHHLLGFEITQLEFHQHFLYSLLFIPLPQWFISIHATLVFASTYCQGSIILSACKLFPPRSETVLHSSTGLRSDPGYFPGDTEERRIFWREQSSFFKKNTCFKWSHYKISRQKEAILPRQGRRNDFCQLAGSEESEGPRFSDLSTQTFPIQFSQSLSLPTWALTLM